MVVATAALLGGACSDEAAQGSELPASVPNPLTDPEDGPPAGNPEGDCDIPAQAGLEDVSNPTTVVGTGTQIGRASCRERV
jgi:hypothetical protein